MFQIWNRPTLAQKRNTVHVPLVVEPARQTQSLQQQLNMFKLLLILVIKYLYDEDNYPNLFIKMQFCKNPIFSTVEQSVQFHKHS